MRFVLFFYFFEDKKKRHTKRNWRGVLPCWLCYGVVGSGCGMWFLV